MAVASVLCACEPESARRLSGTGNIAIELGQSVLTRAEGAVDGSKMNNLHIWLVGSDGSIKDYIDGTVAYVDDNTRYCTIDAGGATAKALFTNVEKGNYTLYFVANLPSDFPLDSYKKGGRIDYIHGEDVVKSLCSQRGTIGFILPAMEKNQLFETVIRDGALPRKTFSMGEAHDKRFYLECKNIQIL